VVQQQGKMGAMPMPAMLPGVAALLGLARQWPTKSLLQCLPVDTGQMGETV
jgi:hypothetical protein